MCLNSLILDTLRTYTRPREVPLPEPDEPGEPAIYDDIDAQELWSIIQSLLADERERRVAYLLYQAGLKPRQIIQFCPQEFSDIREIYRLSRNIIERLMRRADFLRWQLRD
jgi:DNA-directed RNA polymerase specialized sigma subunit